MYVYLSFHQHNRDTAERIREHLLRERFSVWSEQVLIEGTQRNRYEAIEHAVSDAGCVIALLSPDFKNDEQTALEIKLARAKKVPVVSVMVLGDKVRSIPFALISQDFIDMRGESAYHEGLAQLVLALKGHIEQASVPKHVFISYSHRDQLLMARLQSQLTRARFPVWIDVNNLRAGTTINWERSIQDAIDAAGCLVLLMSPDARASQSVTNEIEYAITHDIPVIPLLIRDEDNLSVPSRLKLYQYIDLRGDLYRINFAAVIASVKNFVMQIDDEDFDIFNYLSVAEILPEYVFTGARALDQSELICTYVNQPVTLPPALEVARVAYMDAKVKNAIEKNQTLDNNLSYSFSGLSVSREQDELGHRHNIYRMSMRPTDYFHFVFPNLALDETITLEGAVTTPRRYLKMDHSALRLENLHTFPIHYKVGTGVIFITSDNQVVISIRSSLQFVVGGTAFHLSGAEGMLRPVDEKDGIPSPFLTASRALKDELGLDPDEDYRMQDLCCIGIMLDTRRAQPFCMFYIESQQITFKELKQKWLLEAVDRHENRDIIGRGWNKQIANDLIDGRLIYNGEEIIPASNHAQIGYKLAVLHKFGASFFKID